MGFALKDIAHLTALKQNSNWIEIENFIYYRQILELHSVKLYDDIEKIKEKLQILDAELKDLDNKEFYMWKASTAQTEGFPISCLGLLSCPVCGGPLSIDNASIKGQSIYSADIKCGCGYKVEIANGIIHCGITNNPALEIPDILFNSKKALSNEFNAAVQHANNWLMQRISDTSKTQRVFLETRLNSYFFLYPNLKSLEKDDVIILCDRFREVLLIYKQYIERLNLGLKVIYILSDNETLPIKNNSVDIAIDFFSTNTHSLYSKHNYMPRFQKYLKDDGYIAGMYLAMKKVSKSLGKIRQEYPNCHPNCYRLSLLKDALASYNLIELEPTDSINDCVQCTLLPFFTAGDEVTAYCYVADKKSGSR